MTNKTGKIMAIVLAAAMIGCSTGCGSNTSQDTSSQAAAPIVSEEDSVSSAEERSVVTELAEIDKVPNTADVKYSDTYNAMAYEGVGLEDSSIDENGYMLDKDRYVFEYTRTVSEDGGKRVITCSDIKVTEYYDAAILAKGRSSVAELGKHSDNPTNYYDFMENPETEVAEAFTKMLEDITVSYGSKRFIVTYKGEEIAKEFTFSAALNAMAGNAEEVYSDDPYMLNFIKCSENDRKLTFGSYLESLIHNFADYDFNDMDTFEDDVTSGKVDIKTLSETEADYVGENLYGDKNEVIIKKNGDRQYAITVLLGHHTRLNQTVSFEIAYTN